MSRPLILIGPSGSGKSAVAQALSDGHGYLAVDPGREVAQDGTTLTEAFVQDPEAAEERMREVSLLVLQNLTDGMVVELSPSSPVSTMIREAIQQRRDGGAIVIYLDASLDALARRSGLNAAQPGFLGTPRAWFRELNTALAEQYEGLYDLHCDTTHADPGAIAEQIIGAITIN